MAQVERKAFEWLLPPPGTVCAVLGLLALFSGCAQLDRIEAALVSVQGDVSVIKTGDIGGDGDSIVSWIMAGGYVVILAGGVTGLLLYAMAWRPLRRRFWPEKPIRRHMPPVEGPS